MNDFRDDDDDVDCFDVAHRSAMLEESNFLGIPQVLREVERQLIVCAVKIEKREIVKQFISLEHNLDIHNNLKLYLSKK